MRYTKKTVGILLLLLVTPIFLSLVNGDTNQSFNIESVMVNEKNISESKVILAPGDTAKVEVTFKSEINSPDVKVRAGIFGENVSVSGDSEFFEVIQGNYYTKIIELTITSDISEATLADLVIEVMGKTNKEEDGFKVLIADNPNSFKDYGEDLDNDGLYDYLIVEFNLTVPEEGDYQIWAELENNFMMAGDNGFYLNEGLNTVQIKFSGMKIYEDEMEGPFKLTNLDIEKRDNTFELHLEGDIYSTFNYSYKDFDRIGIKILNITDYGEDMDNDGLYDYLTLEVEVNVTETNDYEFSWAILPNNRKEVTNNYNKTFFLEAGNQKITLKSLGYGINVEKQEGPYTLYIIYHNVPYRDFALTQKHTTSYYNYSDFENWTDSSSPTIDLSSPSNNKDYTVDKDEKEYIHFKYKVYDDSPIEYCELIIEGDVKRTSSSIEKEVTQEFEESFHDGNYDWKIRCVDVYGNVGESEKRNFGINEENTKKDSSSSSNYYPPVNSNEGKETKPVSTGNSNPTIIIGSNEEENKNKKLETNSLNIILLAVLLISIILVLILILIVVRR